MSRRHRLQRWEQWQREHAEEGHRAAATLPEWRHFQQRAREALDQINACPDTSPTGCANGCANGMM